MEVGVLNFTYNLMLILMQLEYEILKTLTFQVNIGKSRGSNHF